MINRKINLGRKLFHQYLLQKWIDLETTRLTFLRLKQSKLRVDLYKGLMDAAAKFYESRDIGKVVVLPSSHPGSPRQMYELYQDAMAIVGKFGKPDLFITMTCNPEWPEITSELEPGQTAWDRPEIVCRVFNQKKESLIKDITEKGIFGWIKASVYVIEFQKRGLPHCHLLVILDDEFKLDTAEKVDKCISAQIPDLKQHPKLYELVLKHMIHMPCHSPKPKCKPKPFSSVCNKNFPKELQEKTILDENSYPRYCRPHIPDIIYRGKNVKINNKYVVPYNAFLLLKYQCHINVEVCSTTKAVKYLYKYIYKGHDKALVDVDGFDEITRYIDSRYISSMEATWRLLGYKTHDRYPFVERLPVHVQDGQNVYFKESDELQKISQQKTTTQLLEWFVIVRL